MRPTRPTLVPRLVALLLALVAALALAACASTPRPATRLPTPAAADVLTADPRVATRTPEPTAAPRTPSPASRPTAAPPTLIPGAPANGGSGCARISADGRYVAFASGASNLAAGDTNGDWDVFVRDRLTGQTKRVSVATGGGEANGGSSGPAISADGRWVAFESTAGNLVPGDTNQAADVFIHDRKAGGTELVSVGLDGRPAGGASWMVALSADGRYVTFASAASNLVAGATAGEAPAYYTFDREAHTIRLAEAPRTATEVSADARWELYAVVEPNPAETPGPAPTLAPGVPPSWTTLYLRERQSGETRQVARFLAPWRGGVLCRASGPSLSADGRWAAYLAPGEQAAGTYGIFLYDRESGASRPVTIGADGESEGPSISADGRFTAFTSFAQNLVPRLATGRAGIYVYDRDADRIDRVDVASGTQLPTATSPTPCPVRPTFTPGPLTWRRVGDAWLGYSFEVPTTWLETEHATADRLMFFSDPAVFGQPEFCPLPNGLIKLDFGADPPFKGPNLDKFTPTTIDGRPAWIYEGEGGEAAPGVRITCAYILGPQYGYLLWFGCTPPAGGSRGAFLAASQAIVDHVLGSFRAAPDE